MSIDFNSGTFTSTGQSGTILLLGKCNVLIEGGEGTVQIERSVTGEGGPYFPISRDSSGTLASYSTSSGNPVGFNGTFDEPEQGGHHYRFNCTAYVGGSINWRFGR